MDTAIIIALIGGSSGIISAVSTAIFKALEYRKAQKGELFRTQLKPFLDKLEAQDKELHEIRLDTTRTQLLMLMEHQPENHDTILKVAHRYFVDLKGNWWMASEFMNWAKNQGVQVPPQIWDIVSKEQE